MYERSKAVTRGILLLSLSGVAVFAVHTHLSRRGIVASRVTEPYRVFHAPADPRIHARIGGRATRSDVYAVAVMIWNRGDATARTPRSAKIVIEPRKRIIAVQTLAPAKTNAHVVVDLGRASSGELTVSWTQLDPDDGLALHIALEGRGTTLRIEHLPTAVYWAFDWKTTFQMIVLYTLVAFVVIFREFVSPTQGFEEGAVIVLVLFAVGALFLANTILPDYVQYPPAKLRAAIATRYPQLTIFPR